MADGEPTLALPDVDVLIALVSPNHAHHAAAHAWFTATTAWATTPFTEAAFLRLLLNPAVIGGEVPFAEAVDLLRRLRRQGDHRFLPDDTSLADAHTDLSGLVGPQQVTDFHLVNLARRHEAVLATFDGKLARALAANDRTHVWIVPL